MVHKTEANKSRYIDSPFKHAPGKTADGNGEKAGSKDVHL